MSLFQITHVAMSRPYREIFSPEQKRKFLFLGMMSFVFFLLAINFFFSSSYLFMLYSACAFLTFSSLYFLRFFKAVQENMDRGISHTKINEINKVRAYYPEVDHFVADKLNRGVYLTNRDHSYLAISKRCKIINKHELFKRLEAISNVAVDRQEFASHVLDDFVIERPFSITDLKNKKLKMLAFYLGAFFVINIITVISVGVGILELVSDYYVAIIMFYVLMAMMMLSMLQSSLAASELDMANDSAYADLEALARVDRQVVNYIRTVRNQGRLLFTLDLENMQIEKRVKMLSNVGLSYDVK